MSPHFSQFVINIIFSSFAKLKICYGVGIVSKINFENHNSKSIMIGVNDFSYISEQKCI